MHAMLFSTETEFHFDIALMQTTVLQRSG